jgi:uncharacterized membrane protein
MSDGTELAPTRPEPAETDALKVIEQVDPELLRELPRNQRPRVLELVRSVTMQFQGPMPPPGVLAEYDSVMPGLADGIYQMALAEQKHRHYCEKELVDSQKQVLPRGQHYGLIFALTGIVAGTVCALAGHDWVAGGIFTFLGGGGITVFVLGREKPSSAPPQPDKSKTEPQQPRRKKNLRTGG